MNSFNEILDFVKDYCKTQMTEVAFNLWIKDIEPVKLTGDEAQIRVNSEFKKNIVSIVMAIVCLLINPIKTFVL